MSLLESLLSKAAKTFSDRPAFVIVASEETSVVSYQEAGTIAERITRRLRAAGLKTGDVILSWADMGIESVLLSWACFAGGFSFVPVDHEWSVEFVRRIIAETSPASMFLDEPRRKALALDGKDHSVPCIMYDNPSQCKAPGTQTFTEWLDQPAGDPFEKKGTELPDETIGVILFTSGSTGNPKGVMLSHKALAKSATLFADHFQIGSGDVFLTLGGVHALGGIRNTCLANLANGSCGVLLEGKPQTALLALPEHIRRLRVTFLSVSPLVIRHLNSWADKMDSTCYSTLKAVLCTGSALDPEQARLFFERTGVPILNYYGLTETTGFCAGHSLKTFLPLDASIGAAIGAQLQVVDDVDCPLPAGQRGHLRIKSDQLMLGYFRNPDLTLEVLREGWFYSGDIAECGTDGIFQLHGRSRNVIKDECSNLIHFEEIELILAQHPEVKEVAVTAIEDRDGHERLAAIIVPTLDQTPEKAQELFQTLNSLIKARAGVRKVVYRFTLVKKIPRGSSGKVLRSGLGELTKP